MATLAKVVGGKKPEFFNTLMKLPDGVSLEKGSVLCFHDTIAYSTKSTEKRGVDIIKLGRAEAYIEFNHNGTISLTIESPNADHLFKLREKVVTYIGGKVIPMVSVGDPNIPSIGMIIKGEIQRLVSMFFSLKQMINLRMGI